MRQISLSPRTGGSSAAFFPEAQPFTGRHVVFLVA
jgi:hypothetical protein